MRRLKREEIAVSPVIATILLVAITVVLATTLWVMLDTDTDGNIPYSATMSAEYDGERYVNLTMISLGTPNTADPGEFEFAIIHSNGQEGKVWGDDDAVNWTYLNKEGKVRSSSEATIHVEEVFASGEFSPGDDLDKMVVFIKGYSGGRTFEL